MAETERITKQQFESYLWGAATLLRGFIDAGDYKQYIFPLLFFKRICDMYDEEYQRVLKESDGDWYMLPLPNIIASRCWKADIGMMCAR